MCILFLYHPSRTLRKKNWLYLQSNSYSVGRAGLGNQLWCERYLKVLYVFILIPALWMHFVNFECGWLQVPCLFEHSISPNDEFISFLIHWTCWILNFLTRSEWPRGTLSNMAEAQEENSSSASIQLLEDSMFITVWLPHLGQRLRAEMKHGNAQDHSVICQRAQWH